MTMNEAAAALKVPAICANNNCVRDAQWRLRESLRVARQLRDGTDAAPDYVVRSVAALQSWVDHDAQRRAA